MKKRKLTALAVLAVVLCLNGCGASSHNDAPASGSYKEEAAGGYHDTYASEEAAAESEDGDYAAEAGDAGGAGDEEPNDSALRAQDGQKIVYTGRLEMQTLEYDKSAASIRAKIRAAGGFSESESERDNNYDWYRSGNSGNTRYLSIIARIPSEKFETFMDSLGGDGKIMSRSVNAENISQVYANKESYKKALEKEQERLLIMMDKAETIDEMIMVEKRLSEVERQLNAYKTDLSAMDKDVQYSTIYIELQEVKRYTEEVVKTPFTEEVKYAFTDAIDSFMNFCKSIILFVVRFFPYLIILGVIIIALLRVSAKDKARRIAMMSDPEYAKMVNARAREKAEREAWKRAQKEAKRGNRKGLFGKKKTETAAAPPQAEKEAAQAPETADRSNADQPAENKGEDGGQSD